MQLIREAEAFFSSMTELYFERRDFDALPEYMEERTSWIGSGEGEICRNLQEARLALQQESAEYCGTFTVTDRQYEILPLSDTICAIYGTLRAVPQDTKLSEENLRFTIILEKTMAGIRLVHLHFSHPDISQEHGRHFVFKGVRADNQTLRTALDSRRRQVDNLTRNIPGGVHQCRNDKELSLLGMSDGFLSMFGYTQEEIGRLFDNKFICMVHPADRELLLSSVKEQLALGTELELEYRVLQKCGTPLWILDKARLLDDGNGNECFYCLLIDITDRKRQQEELRLSLERHQVIMNQTTDIIFEWDIPRDILSFSSNWRKKFGYEPVSQEISHRIPISENIHPEDIPAFVNIMRDTADGIPYSETEFRIRDSLGRFLWCRIRATAQYDENKRPIKAVGVIIDIDAEKRQRQALLEQAQQDALTGLYNKSTVTSLVEQRMQEKCVDKNQALLIIDVDNFKAVNDTYGHLCGDSLLSDVAAVLKSHIRASDLAGRIGGDEFLVYLPEITDETAARAKAERIIAALQQLRPIQSAPPITCSIGVALFPRGSIDYFALFKCADQALYYRKNIGRCGVSFFSPAICDGKVPCGLSNSAVNTPIGSDDGNVADERLAQYAFRSLYAASDIETALNQLLEILGRSYDVSRAYIFESSADGQCASITFEWCADGVPSQKDSLQNLSYKEDLGDYQKNFDKSGVFYCHNIDSMKPDLYEVLRPQGIHSMLQCAILEGGRFWGGVGFDECRENKYWGPGQIASFKLTAQVLSTFLVKLRMLQEMERLTGK